MSVLNNAYAPHSISFSLTNLTTTVSANFSQPNINNIFETIMPSLHSGDWSTLNIYIVPNLMINMGWLGYCSLPDLAAYPEAGPGELPLSRDGCIVDIATLPGVGFSTNKSSDQADSGVRYTTNSGMDPEKTLGMTVVHEVGHWFGLLHVFYPENSPSCVGDGDFVSDTPLQKAPSTGCRFLSAPSVYVR